MSTAIQSIPTRYRGIRYRSKLEADWARFLDAMGLEKRYEPEGQYVGPRDGIFVFCDFYLPETNAWLEVKGKWTKEELLKFSYFAEWAWRREQNQDVFAAGPGGLIGLIVPQHVGGGDIVEARFGVCDECGLTGFASRLTKCPRQGCDGRITANANLQGGPISHRWPDGSEDPSADPWIQRVKEGAPWYADVG